MAQASEQTTAPPPCLITPELVSDYEGLSTHQKYAFAKFAQGHNIFVSGPGGTGKTRLIQFLVKYMEEYGTQYQVCAMTGCAAVLLNCKARTIHSWSGVKLARGEDSSIVQRVMRNSSICTSWKSTAVLIVDEVSMMSRKMFGLLDMVGRHTRRNLSRPFGGIQLVFTGDFFQLPPIKDGSDPATGEFCFQHPHWSKTFPSTDCIELKKFFRQTDPEYIKILQEVRIGQISEESIATLETRISKSGATREDGIVPTKLFPIRTKVDFINTTMYSKLSGEERVYNYGVTNTAVAYLESGTAIPAQDLIRCREMTEEQIHYEVENITSSMQVEKLVRLKVGALVMCVANLDVENGICNGSQGIVIRFEDFVDMNGATIPTPVVKFMNGSIRRIQLHSKQSEDYPSIVVSQIPLRLAWALTIHKIQGATLDVAEIDIGKSVFEYGQTYVALSRVKTLAGLYLSEFNPSKIRANPIVIEFYNSCVQLGEDSMSSMANRILHGISSPKRATTPHAIGQQKPIQINKLPSSGVSSSRVGENIFNAFEYSGSASGKLSALGKPSASASLEEESYDTSSSTIKKIRF